MRKFIGIARGGNYTAGCTGQSVFVYDKEGREAAKFSGLKYAYLPMISQDGKILAVKSVEPYLWFYSLETLQLLKKIRLRKNNQSQDVGCCFSPRGNRFINIELKESLSTCLTVYNMETFEEEERLFDDDEYLFTHIEREDPEERYLLLGIRHGEWENEESENTYFIAESEGGRLRLFKELEESAYDYLSACKRIELFGETEASKVMASLKENEEYKSVVLREYLKDVFEQK